MFRIKPFLLFILFFFISLPSFALSKELPAMAEIKSFFTQSFEGIFELKWELSDQCLRTGYSHREGAIYFCQSDELLSGGILSEDVQRHESFHQMLCQLRSDWCSENLWQDRESLAIHEALADFFASSFDQTPYFGEGYYQNQPWIRSYQNDLIFGLTTHPYLIAGILNREWKSVGLTRESFIKYLQEGELSLSSLQQYGLGIFVSDYAKIIPKTMTLSSLNRYRISLQGASFDLVLPSHLMNVNEGMDIGLVDEQGESHSSFFLTRISNSFTIIPKDASSRGRVFVQLKNDEGVIIGLLPLYLSVKK